MKEGENLRFWDYTFFPTGLGLVNKKVKENRKKTRELKLVKREEEDVDVTTKIWTCQYCI